jgi:phage gpG-like protein
VDISLDVFGDVQLKRKILRIGDRAEDAAPALRGLADYFRGIESEQFATQGQSGSGGWPELKPSTIRKRLAGRRDASVGRFRSASTGRFQSRSQATASLKILDDTGALKDSLTDAGDEQHIERVSRDELAFGTIVPYARFHQMGTSRMDQRRPVELTEPERKEAVRKLQRYLMTGEVAR